MSSEENMGNRESMDTGEKSLPGISRRNFIKGTAIGAAGVVAGVATAGWLAGCASKTQNQTATPGEAGKPSFMIPPPPIQDKDIKTTVTADVIVVGGGMSGFCAAISAAQAGAKVVLLEKTSQPQFRGLELGAIGSKMQKSIGNNIDRDEAVYEIMRWGGYKNDQRVVQVWADNSGAAIDWILGLAKDVGIDAKPAPVENQEVPGSIYKSFPTNACILIPNENVKYNPQMEIPSQAALRYVLATSAKKAGVDIRFNTPAAQLVRQDKGRVTGIIAKNEDGSFAKFNANKGVILCTGDYGNDPEMLKYYIPSSLNIYNIVYTGIANTGDGHKMGLWAGAGIDEAPHAPMYFDQGVVGYKSGKPVALTRQPWLGVNLQGERYANEDVPYAFVCNGERQQNGHVKWVVWDSKWPEETKRMHMIICKEMVPPFHIPAEIDDLINKEIIKSANTIDELVQKMNVPADTFKATVARYNELTKQGKDLDFGKRPQALTTIEKPPFYACQLATSLLVTLGGLTINDKLQVLDKERNAIPGLYAAGNVSGCFYANDYPITVSGNSHGRAFTFGWLAGKNAAGEKA